MYIILFEEIFTIYASIRFNVIYRKYAQNVIRSFISLMGIVRRGCGFVRLNVRQIGKISKRCLLIGINKEMLIHDSSI